MTNSSPREGWLYVARLVSFAAGVLFCLAFLKFLTEHRLAPKNFGLGGALSQPKLDLLLIGSSHTRKSYDMQLLDRLTGITRSFLIGYDGTDLCTIFQILNFMAATPEHCPRHVVIEAYSAFLARKPELEDPRYYADAPPSLKMTIIGAYFSQHGYRSSVFDMFDLVVNRGNEEIVTYPIYSLVLRRNSYKGGGAGITFPGVSAEQFKQFTAGAITPRPDWAQVRALNQILDLAARHRMSVIFVETPIPKPVSSVPGIQALKSKFGELVAVRHYRYIDGDRGFPTDDPSMFSDSNHLSSAGREVFTSKIAVELKSWIAQEYHRMGDPPSGRALK